MRSFSGTVAVFTRAGFGIGRSLTVKLAGHGCHLALCDVNEEGLAGTVDLIQNKSIEVTTA